MQNVTNNEIIEANEKIVKLDIFEENEALAELSRIAQALSDKAETIREVVGRVDEGEPMDEAVYLLSDEYCDLLFDIDALDEALDLGYAQEKADAIISVAGVATVLSNYADHDGSVTMGAAQARQMAKTLMQAAKTMDNHANRSTLFA